jgi:hypothetical protein
MLKARSEVHAQLDEVAAVAEELTRRYAPDDSEIDDSMRENLRRQAAKRVAVRFRVEEAVSWDHSKLGGAY